VSAGILAAAAIFIAVLQLNLHGAAVCGYSWLQLPLLSARSSQAATDNGATLAPTGLAPGCLLAFADIHGDLQQALRVLQLVGAIDQDGKWAAGSCTLVQTGDLVDRGPQSLTVLRLFERLKEEAVQAGGQLITLMGNHEMESIQVWDPYSELVGWFSIMQRDHHRSITSQSQQTREPFKLPRAILLCSVSHMQTVDSHGTMINGLHVRYL
jgi:hypothetical protein